MGFARSSGWLIQGRGGVRELVLSGVDGWGSGRVERWKGGRVREEEGVGEVERERGGGGELLIRGVPKSWERKGVFVGSDRGFEGCDRPRPTPSKKSRIKLGSEFAMSSGYVILGPDWSLI